MTDAISNNNPPQNNAVKGGTPTKADSGSGKAASSPKSGASTIVELGNANVMQRLSDKIQELPEINSAKIESVKQALVKGEYQPDAEVIAKKFSEIEKLLP